MPLINCRRVDLIDHKRLIAQICNLERTTGRGTGRDIVDHPRDPNAHDDCSNAAAGALVLAASRKLGMVITPEILKRANEVPFYMRKRLVN